jgi:hypothetical protein
MGGYTRAVSEKRLGKQVPAGTDMNPTVGKAVFPMWNVPRCYKQGIRLELSLLSVESQY